MKKQLSHVKFNLVLKVIFKKNNILYAALLFIPLIGCKKFVEIGAPVTSINSGNVYQTDFTAAAVLTGIYTDLSEGLSGSGLASMTLLPALSSDELTLFGGVTSSAKLYIPYYTNSLNSSNVLRHTAPIYSTIYTINSAIEGITGSNKLTPILKQQLLGEAKFMRGFCYFYMTELYGDVPLVLTTNYKINSVITKSSKNVVYAQIITDLKDAQNLLSDQYLKADAMAAYTSGVEERVRPTKWAATALLARVYLYDKKWSDAERESTSVINNSSLFQLTDLANTFLKNNKESIWQLQPVTKGYNTEAARLFVLPSSGPTAVGNRNFYLSKYLIDSFESNDLRAKLWVNSIAVKGTTYYYSFKYKVIAQNVEVSEYTVVLRLAEQYLIRAEARIQNGNIGNGIADLNIIRNRASDQNPGAIQLIQLSTTLNKGDALKAVLHERQVELFIEWGHRWFDLKRMGYANGVMDVVTKEKGGTWNTNWQLYPFYIDELRYDPNLVQNSGY
ncbi:RagB/SusD family nutrient uptake outer membrane protein [Pedobacter sp. HMWF019]|uniref:RagB/SusD family nutrient uptake outer membrane protein n=1 Tax=Pedobacter sp. HMWF019 TaxID=2056856 RepID=UPI000D37D976|nr:RagB/SusD family nutrient uptake outer membrane protein [Pedobacter sp. HMWF019]PTT00025.1 RagB/SusD family nutrient uptake outer membrane protein [Pedobacter sp. HMWF019]